MDNLQYNKGASGYTAPGPIGSKGDDGKKSFFSVYSIINEIEKIKSLISASKPLSNNKSIDSMVVYNIGDIILDKYGNLGIIVNISPLSIRVIGNVIFKNTSFDNEEYTCPVNYTTGECVLYYNAYDFSQDADEYIKRTQYDTETISFEDNSPLYAHRYQSGIYAKGYKLLPSTSLSDTYALKDSEGNKITCKQFVDKIKTENEFSRVCAVINDGIIIEGVIGTNELIIYNGYFDMIPLEILSKQDSNFVAYTSFSDEIAVQQKYLNAIKNENLCNMYFEFYHDGLPYTMKIKIV